MKGSTRKRDHSGVQRVGRPTVATARTATEARNAALWWLPDEVLLIVAKQLHVRDVLNLCSTSRHLRELIYFAPCVWSNVKFTLAWPSSATLRHFVKASAACNFEAAIKVAIATLHNVRLGWDSTLAEYMFRKAEMSPRIVDPITWLFLQPGWTPDIASRKTCTLSKLQSYVTSDNHAGDNLATMCVSIARTMEFPAPQGFVLLCLTQVCPKDVRTQSNVMRYLKTAADHGSHAASYSIWKHNYDDKQYMDSMSKKLCSIRELREISRRGSLSARIRLCKLYVSDCDSLLLSSSLSDCSVCDSCNSGVGHDEMVGFVRNFVQRSSRLSPQDAFLPPESTNHTRYALLDGIIRLINTIQDAYSGTRTLHVAVTLLDRFMLIQKTPDSEIRKLVQATLVLATRLLGREIRCIGLMSWMSIHDLTNPRTARVIGEVISALQ